MKYFSEKHILLTAFLLGLTAGILYANLTADAYLAESGIFSTFFLSQYSGIRIDKREFLLYLLPIRLLPVGVMGVLAAAGARKTAAAGSVVWFGFLGGVLFVTSVMQMGMKGMILCVVAMFPQILLYVLAYAVILWSLYAWPAVRWSFSKTVFTILVFAVGILLEVYVNPVLLKLYLGSLQP